MGVEDIDSVERIAGNYPAAAVGADLEPHRAGSAASVGWEQLGSIVDSKLWEFQILHAQAVSSWGPRCPRIDAE